MKEMPVSVETTPLLLKVNLKQLKLPTMLAEWEKLAVRRPRGTKPTRATCCD